MPGEQLTMNDSYFEKLVQICQGRGFELQSKTRTANGKFVLYKVVLNPQSPGQTLCFSAGVHGNEPSGPWAILEFLKTYHPQDGDPRMVILPVLNPDGFFRNKRMNYDRINLNRHFFQKPVPDEIKTLMSLVEKEKIDYFLALHEDDEKKGFYLYRYGENNLMADQITDFLSKRTLLCRDHKIYGEAAIKGVIAHPKTDGSFENWMYRQGIPSVCLEAPDSVSFEKKVTVLHQLMLQLVKAARI